jgi:hypothetical protein
VFVCHAWEKLREKEGVCVAACQSKKKKRWNAVNCETRNEFVYFRRYREVRYVWVYVYCTVFDMCKWA